MQQASDRALRQEFDEFENAFLFHEDSWQKILNNAEEHIHVNAIGRAERRQKVSDGHDRVLHLKDSLVMYKKKIRRR